MKFQEGQTVFVLDEKESFRNAAQGTVVYAEDNYYVVVLANGVEMEYSDPSRLMTEEEYSTRQEQERDKAVVAQEKRSDLFADLFANAPTRTPNKHERKLDAKVMDMIKRVNPKILLGMKTKVPEFENLAPSKQLDALSDLTGTPVAVFHGAAEFNDDTLMRAVLQKTLVNNIFSGSDLVGDIILGMARETIEEYEKSKN